MQIGVFGDKFFMPYQLISLREANHNFSRLIAAVERGEAFCITRRGQEVARLTPASTRPAGMDQARSTHASPAPDSSLGERVRRLEARLDKLSPALTPTDEKNK